MKSKASILAFILSLNLCAQLEVIHPATFPISVSDFHVFNDGSALFVSEYDRYMVWLADIENPITSAKKYYPQASVKLHTVQCFNALTCLGIGAPSPTSIEGIYSSNDGGKSWVLAAQNPNNESIIFLAPSVWLKTDFTGTVLFTDDSGANWQTNLGTLINNDRQSAYILNSRNVYSIGASSTSQLLFNIDSLFGATAQLDKLLEGTNSHFVALRDGRIFSVDKTTKQATLLYSYVPGTGLLFTATGLTELVFFNESEVISSSNNGLTWQRDSISVPWFWVGQMPFDDSPPNVYQGSVYWAAQSNSAVGIWLQLDLNNGAVRYSSGSNYVAESRVLPKYLGDGLFFTQDDRVYTSDTTRLAVIFNENGTLENSMHTPLGSQYFSGEALTFIDSLNGAGVVIRQQTPEVRFVSTSNGGQTFNEKPITGLNAHSSMSYNLRFNAAEDEQGYQITFYDTIVTLNAQGDLLHKTKAGRPSTPTGLRFLRFAHFETAMKGLVQENRFFFYTNNGGATYSQVLSVVSAGFNTDLLKSNGKLYLLAGADIYEADSLGGPYTLLKSVNSTFNNNGYQLTKSLKVFGFDSNKNELRYSADTGTSFAAAPVLASHNFCSEVVETNDSTFLIFGSPGEIQKLTISDALVFNGTDTLGLSNDGSNGIALIEKQLNDFAFFPNPTVQNLNLKFPDKAQRKVLLLNRNGQIVLQENSGSSHHQIDLSAYPGGVYVLKVYTDGKVQTRQILKLEY